CIGFLQHPDNLLFTEPRFLHDKVSPAALPLTLQWDTSEGKGHTRRKALKLTQTELARRLGVDDAYISAIERGVRTPGDVVFIDQLGRALALDADGRLGLEAVAESSKRLLRLSDPLPLYKYQVIAALVRDQHLTEADMDTIAKVHAAIVQIRNATAAAVSIDGGTM
ncbi:helix-turn-helix transcriptional regulator, partial [Burkholderia contaminans]|nr:helix-turn-helix transcriptional regulator [Burkholderia contaminans]